MKTKPFNLKAALNDEPVMLRNGMKAFVRHHETKTSILGKFNLVGIKEGYSYYLTWTEDGGYDIDGDISDLDIVGMWTEPRIINGFEVPAPESVELEDGAAYYIPSVSNKEFYGYSEWIDPLKFDLRSLKRGLVFLNKEDAIANAKAMLGINPYEESEE
jgi:hypothetical protein